MKTIVVTATQTLWEEAQKAGQYTQSTIDQKLENVGFIHATNPDQTIAMLNRHFTERDNILLLLVDLSRVKSEVKFEAPLSGSGGVYPHIYGPLNTDAVYDTLIPSKDSAGNFLTEEKLSKM